MAFDDREDRNQIPCIIDEGIIANRRDMLRVLRDLGHVRYAEFIGEEVHGHGEGIVSNVYAHDRAATIIANKRLYLNVNGFDYLKLSRPEADITTFDLIVGTRILRLEPLSDPLREGRLGERGFLQVYEDEDMIVAELSEDEIAELLQDEERDD